MTAADLLDNPDFLALCAQWEAAGRAPACGADWLEQRDMLGQARGWAAMAMHPFARRPFYYEMDRAYYWHTNPDGWGSMNADILCGIPNELFDGHCHNFPSKPPVHTFEAAVVAFLDRWAEVFGTSPVPPPELTEAEL